MNSLSIALLGVIVILLGLCVGILFSIRKLCRGLRAQMDRIAREQKNLKTRFEARPTNPASSQALGDVHRALAAQITQAGETLDRKISDLLSQAHPRGTSAGETEERGKITVDPAAPHTAWQAMIHEFSILHKGLQSAPERFLNLVHGIPKAGNTTLLSSLWASSKIADGALSSHFLSGKAMRDLQLNANTCLDLNDKTLFVRTMRVRKLLGEQGYLNDWPRSGDASTPAVPLKVICPFRDPVASALSLGAYVQSVNLSKQPITPHQPLAEGRNPIHPENFAWWMRNWVESEIEELYGINILGVPFDQDRGFGLYRGPRHHLLILTLESASRWPEAIAEFFNCQPEDVNIVKSNEASTRNDATAYRELVDRFRMTRAMARRIYSSPFLEYLYSEAQREQFIAKWTG